MYKEVHLVIHFAHSASSNAIGCVSRGLNLAIWFGISVYNLLLQNTQKKKKSWVFVSAYFRPYRDICFDWFFGSTFGRNNRAKWNICMTNSASRARWMYIRKWILSFIIFRTIDKRKPWTLRCAQRLGIRRLGINIVRKIAWFSGHSSKQQDESVCQQKKSKRKVRNNSLLILSLNNKKKALASNNSQQLLRKKPLAPNMK